MAHANHAERSVDDLRGAIKFMLQLTQLFAESHKSTVEGKCRLTFTEIYGILKLHERPQIRFGFSIVSVRFNGKA